VVFCRLKKRVLNGTRIGNNYYLSTNSTQAARAEYRLQDGWISGKNKQVCVWVKCSRGSTIFAAVAATNEQENAKIDEWSRACQLQRQLRSYISVFSCREHTARIGRNKALDVAASPYLCTCRPVHDSTNSYLLGGGYSNAITRAIIFIISITRQKRAKCQCCYRCSSMLVVGWLVT